MSYLVDPEDEDTQVSFAAKSPPMRKKAPHPTILFELPPYKKFIFELTNTEEST